MSKFKKLKKNLIIILLILILFNFMMPTRVNATWWANTIKDIEALPARLVQMIGIGIYRIVNNIFVSEANKATSDGTKSFLLTPDNIIKGKFVIFNANIFKVITNADAANYYDVETSTSGTDATGSISNFMLNGRNELRNNISGWYYTLRNFALVSMLAVLSYIGIRMVMSTLAQDKAKYISMFKDWLVAICLLMVMHYIMIGTLTAVDLITDTISGGGKNMSVIDQAQIIINCVLADGDNDNDVSNYIDIDGLEFDDNGESGDYNCHITYKQNISIDGTTQEVTVIDDDYSLSDVYAYELIFFAVVGYTFIFAWKYLIREFTLIFLILLGPITCITYPIDKVSDGQAQAFNKWLTEFIYQALIQPFHLLIYLVLVGTGSTLAQTNIIYAIACFAVIFPAEKFIKSMFGFKDSLGSPLSNMMKMDMFKNITGGNGSGGNNSKPKEKEVPDLEKQDKKPPVLKGGTDETDDDGSGASGSGGIEENDSLSDEGDEPEELDGDTPPGIDDNGGNGNENVDSGMSDGNDEHRSDDDEDEYDGSDDDEDEYDGSEDNSNENGEARNTNGNNEDDSDDLSEDKKEHGRLYKAVGKLRKSKRDKRQLKYGVAGGNIEDLLHFHNTDNFKKAWKSTGKLTQKRAWNFTKSAGKFVGRRIKGATTIGLKLAGAGIGLMFGTAGANLGMKIGGNLARGINKQADRITEKIGQDAATFHNEFWKDSKVFGTDKEKDEYVTNKNHIAQAERNFKEREKRNASGGELREELSKMYEFSQLGVSDSNMERVMGEYYQNLERAEQLDSAQRDSWTAGEDLANDKEKNDYIAQALTMYSEDVASSYTSGEFNDPEKIKLMYKYLQDKIGYDNPELIKSILNSASRIKRGPDKNISAGLFPVIGNSQQRTIDVPIENTAPPRNWNGLENLDANRYKKMIIRLKNSGYSDDDIKVMLAGTQSFDDFQNNIAFVSATDDRSSVAAALGNQASKENINKEMIKRLQLQQAGIANSDAIRAAEQELNEDYLSAGVQDYARHLANNVSDEKEISDELKDMYKELFSKDGFTDETAAKMAEKTINLAKNYKKAQTGDVVVPLTFNKKKVKLPAIGAFDENSEARKFIARIKMADSGIDDSYIVGAIKYLTADANRSVIKTELINEGNKSPTQEQIDKRMIEKLKGVSSLSSSLSKGISDISKKEITDEEKVEETKGMLARNGFSDSDIAAIFAGTKDFSASAENVKFIADKAKKHLSEKGKIADIGQLLKLLQLKQAGIADNDKNGENGIDAIGAEEAGLSKDYLDAGVQDCAREIASILDPSEISDDKTIKSIEDIYKQKFKEAGIIDEAEAEAMAKEVFKLASMYKRGQTGEVEIPLTFNKDKTKLPAIGTFDKDENARKLIARIRVANSGIGEEEVANAMVNYLSNDKERAEIQTEFPNASQSDIDSKMMQRISEFSKFAGNISETFDKEDIDSEEIREKVKRIFGKEITDEQFDLLKGLMKKKDDKQYGEQAIEMAAELTKEQLEGLKSINGGIAYNEAVEKFGIKHKGVKTIDLYQAIELQQTKLPECFSTITDTEQRKEIQKLIITLKANNFTDEQISRMCSTVAEVSEPGSVHKELGTVVTYATSEKGKENARAVIGEEVTGEKRIREEITEQAQIVTIEGYKGLQCISGKTFRDRKTDEARKAEKLKTIRDIRESEKTISPEAVKVGRKLSIDAVVRGDSTMGNTPIENAIRKEIERNGFKTPNNIGDQAKTVKTIRNKANSENDRKNNK